MGAIVFHEDNGGRGDVVGIWYEGDSPLIVNFKRTPGFRNDEARSLRIISVPRETTIKLFDDVSGKTSDDWVEIVTLKPVEEYSVNSFEKSYEDATVKVSFHREDGGLGGKVSRAEISTTATLQNPGLIRDSSL